jgi:hypothetical protein
LGILLRVDPPENGIGNRDAPAFKRWVVFWWHEG